MPRFDDRLEQFATTARKVSKARREEALEAKERQSKRNKPVRHSNKRNQPQE